MLCGCVGVGGAEVVRHVAAKQGKRCGCVKLGGGASALLSDRAMLRVRRGWWGSFQGVAVVQDGNAV